MQVRAWSVAIIYAVFAALWIVLSATILSFTVSDPVTQGRIEMLKGLAFVLVTAGLLYGLLRRNERVAALETSIPAATPDEPRRFLPIVLGLALMVPVIGISVFLIHATSDEADSLRDLEAIAQLKTSQMENWLSERRGDGTTLAASTGFIERIESYRSTSNAREKALFENRLGAMLQAYNYSSIRVLDPAGRTLSAIGDPTDPVTPDLHARITAAFQSGKVQTAQLIRDTNGELHLDFIVPLTLPKDGASQPIAVVILTTDSRSFLTPLLRSWPASSDSGEIHLVHREGDSVSFSEGARGHPSNAPALKIPLSQADRPAVMAVTSGKPGLAKGVDHRGVPVLAAWRPVAGTEWFLVAKFDRAEATEPARESGLWISAVTLIALLMVGFALYQVWRTQRKSDRLKMQAESDHLSRLFYELPFIGMAISSAGTGRVLQCNDRLCAMLGYSHEEFRALTWEQLTHPDDLPAEIAKFENVIRGGADGYSMEKRFFRKDGSVMDAEIDIRCMRKPDGTPENFFGTIQDISERKATAEKLLRLNRLYDTLGRCNEAIVRCGDEQELFNQVCRIAVEAGGMKMAWVGMLDTRTHLVHPVASHGEGTGYLDGIVISADAANPFGGGLAGISLREGRPAYSQDFQIDPITRPWRERGETSGWGSSASLPLRRNGIAVGVFAIYSAQSYVFDEDTLNLLQKMADDIGFALDSFDLQKRRDDAEASVRENEERYRLLFDTSLDAIMLTSPDGSIFAANPAACRLFGRTEAELRTLGRAAIIDATDPRVGAAIEERRRTGQFNGELTMLRRDGSTFPVEVSTALFKDRENRQRTTMVIRDISQRKDAEARLLQQLDELRRWHAAMVGREERMLKLKSEINQLLAQAGMPPRYPSASAPAGDSPQTSGAPPEPRS